MFFCSVIYSRQLKQTNHNMRTIAIKQPNKDLRLELQKINEDYARIAYFWKDVPTGYTRIHSNGKYVLDIDTILSIGKDELDILRMNGYIVANH